MPTSFACNICVPVALIHNAMIGAFEGGSTYWLRGAELLKGFRKPEDRLVWWGHQEVFEQPFEIRIRFDDPEAEEGNGAGEKDLTNADIQRALDLMAAKSPTHFADLLTENDDASTHDAFAQYLVLGDIIYG